MVFGSAHLAVQLNLPPLLEVERKLGGQHTQIPTPGDRVVGACKPLLLDIHS